MFTEACLFSQASFAFIDNEAAQNGAAIHATDIKRCTYAPSLNTTENASVAEKSMFELPELFYFRYSSKAVYRATVERHRLMSY